MKTEQMTDRSDTGSDMDELYSGSMGEDAAPKESQDETVDQEDQKEMEGSSVIPLSTLSGEDGETPKEGDKIEVLVMKVYGNKEAQICRADKYPDEEAGESGNDDENEEIDRLSSQRM